MFPDIERNFVIREFVFIDPMESRFLFRRFCPNLGDSGTDEEQAQKNEHEAETNDFVAPHIFTSLIGTLHYST